MEEISRPGKDFLHKNPWLGWPEHEIFQYIEIFRVSTSTDSAMEQSVPQIQKVSVPLGKPL